MGRAKTRQWVLGALTVVLLGAWCGWVSGFHHATVAAYVAWLVSLAGVVVVDLLLWRGRRHHRFALRVSVAEPWPRQDRGGARRMMLGLSPWLVLTLVVVVWEVLGIDTGAHEPHLTISALVQAFRALNAAALLLWILVGLGYGTARARVPAGPKAAPGVPRTSPVALAGSSTIDRQHVVAPALLLPADRAVGVVFWIGLLVACSAVDVVARRSRGRLATAGEVARVISGPPLINALLVAAWTFAGWHLFAH